MDPLDELLPSFDEGVELSDLTEADGDFMSVLLDAGHWARSGSLSLSGGGGSAGTWEEAPPSRGGPRGSTSSEDAEASPAGKVWPAAAEAEAAAAAVAPGPRLQLLRCLDASHAAPCALCTPAPSELEVGDFEVSGEPGKRNGEKLLRALLIQTREWNTGAARERLAAVCDARGADDVSSAKLAVALRSKRSAALTKEHLLFAARAWGYACHLWQRHGRASRKRAAAEEGEALAASASAHRAPHARTHAPPPPPPPRALPSSAEARLLGGGFRWGARGADTTLDALITPESVGEELDAQLRPLAAVAAQLLAGPDARAAACGGACVYFTAADVAEVRGAAAYLAGGVCEWRAAAADAHAACDAAAAVAARALAPEARAAWSVLGREATALETALRAVCATLRGWANNNRTPGAQNDADADAVAENPDARAARRWHSEFFRALVAVTELCTRLQLLLVDAKLVSYDVYLHVAALVADATVGFSDAAAQALAVRAGWMAAMLPPPRAGDSSSARGDAAAAAAAAAEGGGCGAGAAGGRRLLFTCDATAAAAV
jgi:hypothetical protein